MNKITHLPLLVCVRLSLLLDACRRHQVRLLMFLAGTLTTTGARADDDIAGMFISVANGIKSLKQPLIDSSLVIGVAAVFIALCMLAGKKNNPHIKGWHIILAFVVGFCFIALDQITTRGQKQLGLNPVSVG